MQFVQLQCQRFLGITAFSAIYTTSCTWRSDFCCRHALLSACIFITTCVSSWQIGNQNIDFGFMPSRRMQAVSLLLMFDRLVRSKTGILPFRLDRHPNHDRPCLLYPQGMSPLSASICSHANQIHIGVPLRFCFDRSALRRSYCVVIFSDLRILTDVFAPPFDQIPIRIRLDYFLTTTTFYRKSANRAAAANDFVQTDLRALLEYLRSKSIYTFRRDAKT